MTLVHIHVPAIHGHEPWDIIGQAVGAHLAVTPAAGNGELSGYFTVTHVASGCRVVTSLICCYTCALQAARQLADHPVDWAAMTADEHSNAELLGGQIEDLYGIARYWAYTCRSEPCRWEDPDTADPEPHPEVMTA